MIDYFNVHISNDTVTYCIFDRDLDIDYGVAKARIIFPNSGQAAVYAASLREMFRLVYTETATWYTVSYFNFQ